MPPVRKVRLDNGPGNLKCGRLEVGLLRVRCARRMAETAALPADEVMPTRPPGQWVLSLPRALRFLLANDPDALTRL
jgi:hypothetical protein